MLCKFCTRECKNENSKRNHERLCKLNPDRQEPPRGMLGKTHKGGNQFTKNPDYKMSDETRKKLSLFQTGKKWTDEQKLRHSQIMHEVVLANPDSYSAANVCGRVKIYEHNGEKFHGKWELAVIRWLELHGIEWRRKIKPFTYFWNDKWHLYFPDIYLPQYDLFIEIKGYQTDRDLCKWSVVDNLIVLKAKELKQIQNGIGPEALLVGGNELIIRRRNPVAGSSPAGTTIN